VDNFAQLNKTFHEFQRFFDAERHTINHPGPEMVLESLLCGPEVQLELMLRDGHIVFHSFSSHLSPARDALFFPAALSLERRAALLEAAAAAAAALGLREGVVHADLFDDPKHGAVVIEIENSLSRGFLPQSFLHQVSGPPAHPFIARPLCLHGAASAAFRQEPRKLGRNDRKQSSQAWTSLRWRASGISFDVRPCTHAGDWRRPGRDRPRRVCGC
jgi:hypothetical protein